MPTSMPAFCVCDGEVSYAGRITNGYALVVEHRYGSATYYANLEHMFVLPTDRASRRRPTRVKAGDVLGYIGSMTSRGFKCLHFELWRRDDDGHFVDVDPTKFMPDWLLLPWSQPHLTPTDPAAAEAVA
jgi:murein DD-endopeptidase MepM/ murein hydrolase activator NlpD